MNSASCILLMFVIVAVDALIPIKCSNGNINCTLQNYQGAWMDRSLCEVAKVVYPTTEKELIAAVANAVKQKQKMKVVSKLSHSLSKFACPGGSSGLLISTSKYDSNILIRKKAMTVTADAGVQLQDLLKKLADNGLALPAIPYFDGLSISGVISTGAHGSSLFGKGGAVNEHVVALSIVVPGKKEEGYAKLIKLTQKDAELNAARLSLGVLGAISQVTLSVESIFKRSITKKSMDDARLQDDIVGFATNHTFGDINWYPSQRKMILRLDDKVPAATTGEGKNTGGGAAKASDIRSWRIQEEGMMSKQNSSLICATYQSSIADRVKGGDGLVNSASSNVFSGYPVIGFNHLLETGGGCQNAALKSGINSGDTLTCAWDPDVPGQFYFHSSIAIPLNEIGKAIVDIKNMRDLNPERLCALDAYGGAQIRFVKGSSAFLASPTDTAYFEMLYFRDRRFNTARLNEDAIEEIEQLLVKKYKGRPHYGKNRVLTFENLDSKTVNFAEFKRVKELYDPEGYFSSEWSDAVLQMKNPSTGITILKDGCGLEGLCVCSKDSHCAPQQGYRCRSGLIFKEAKVCRKI